MSSEWECFLRARQGDELAWRLLMGRYGTRLNAMALMITGNAAAADDVVQETFVRAFRASIKRCTGTVNGFLGTIAYRLALKEVKREKRHVKLDGIEPIDQAEDPLDKVLKDERDRCVVDAIGDLEAVHRDVLILRFYGDHSYEEIADLLQVPLGTVKSRIFHAVKSCRETLRLKGVLQ